MAEKSEVIVLTDELRTQLKPEFEKLEIAAKDAGRTEGAAAERERIKAIEVQAEGMPGHEALVQEMKFDGKTTGPEAASRILEAEKKKKAARVVDIRADAPKPVPAGTIDDPAKKEDKTDKPVDYVALAKEAEIYQAERAKQGVTVSNIDAMKFVYQRAGVPLK
jgi:hypothetical protein